LSGGRKFLHKLPQLARAADDLASQGLKLLVKFLILWDEIERGYRRLFLRWDPHEWMALPIL
jgi:hypothetical protein